MGHSWAATVEVPADQLDADAGAAALVEVLRPVAKKAGCRLVVRGNLGQVQPQGFEACRSNDGIRLLIDNNRGNPVMRYEVDETGEKQLVEAIACIASARSRRHC